MAVIKWEVRSFDMRRLKTERQDESYLGWWWKLEESEDCKPDSLLSMSEE